MIARNPGRDRKDQQSIGSFLLVGRARQGVTLAADILCEAALYAGFDAISTESHQTNADAEVRAVVQVGGAELLKTSTHWAVDYLVAWDSPQGMDNLRWLSPTGVAIVGGTPKRVSRGVSDDRIRWVGSHADGASEAMELLGAASRLLPFDVSAWRNAVENHLPRKLFAASWELFQNAREMAETQRQARSFTTQ